MTPNRLFEILSHAVMFDDCTRSEMLEVFMKVLNISNKEAMELTNRLIKESSEAT